MLEEWVNGTEKTPACIKVRHLVPIHIAHAVNMPFTERRTTKNITPTRLSTSLLLLQMPR
jgi:hypothetical protein